MNTTEPERWTGTWATPARGTLWQRTIPDNATDNARWGTRLYALIMLALAFVLACVYALFMRGDIETIIITSVVSLIFWVVLRQAIKDNASWWAALRSRFRAPFYEAADALDSGWVWWAWTLYEVEQHTAQRVELSWEAGRGALAWRALGHGQHLNTERTKTLATARSRAPRDPVHELKAEPPPVTPPEHLTGQLVFQDGAIAIEPTHDPDDPSVLTLQLRRTRAPYSALTVTFDPDVCDAHPWLTAVRDRAEPLQRAGLKLQPHAQADLIDAILPHLQAAGITLPAASAAAESVAATRAATATVTQR